MYIRNEYSSGVPSRRARARTRTRAPPPARRRSKPSSNPPTPDRPCPCFKQSRTNLQVAVVQLWVPLIREVRRTASCALRALARATVRCLRPTVPAKRGAVNSLRSLRTWVTRGTIIYLTCGHQNMLWAPLLTAPLTQSALALPSRLHGIWLHGAVNARKQALLAAERESSHFVRIKDRTSF